MQYRLFFLTIFSIIHLWMQAQDNHFSNPENAAPFINPAMTGYFNGTTRVALAYREQWGAAMNTGGTRNHFITKYAVVDWKQNAVCRRRNYFSFGGFILDDEAAAVNLHNLQIAPSASYRLTLGDNSSHATLLMLGASVNVLHQRIDFNGAKWGEQLKDGVFNPNATVNEPQFLTNGTDSRLQQTHIDPSVGFLFSHQFDVNVMPFNTIYGGFSVHHLTQPRRSFIGDNGLPRLGMRWVGQFGGEYAFGTGRLGIAPDVVATYQSQLLFFNAGVDLVYRFGNSKREVNHTRVGSRLRTSLGNVDALIFSAGYDHAAFGIQLLVDTNLSPLYAASRGRGALELALRWRFQSPATSCNSGCPTNF
jgi:type IX secretion system PorP/SprF family membrane protein